MPNLNKVLLIGRLTRDPELRVTPKGTSICQFGIAVNRDFKSDSGEKQTEALFVDIEAWGKSADAITKYLTKGRHIYLEGRLKLDQWEDKNTKEKRSRMKVILDAFQFLDSASSPADQAPSDTASPAPSPAPAVGQARAQAMRSAPAPDEDVPF